MMRIIKGEKPVYTEDDKFTKLVEKNQYRVLDREYHIIHSCLGFKELKEAFIKEVDRHSHKLKEPYVFHEVKFYPEINSAKFTFWGIEYDDTFSIILEGDHKTLPDVTRKLTTYLKAYYGFNYRD